jgi:hypothetical protein
MLSSILKHHQEQMKGRNETQEKLKKETVEAASELTQNLVSLSYMKFIHIIVYMSHLKIRP